jgi:hypothetical protein
MGTPTITPSLPLTSVSAADVQQQLINLLKSTFPDWTDTQASNNMIMLLETMSAITEMDYAYINRMAREAFLPFALDYRNVLAHARALGYRPSYQSPSTVTAVISSASIAVEDITILAGTQFATKISGIIYQTVNDTIILRGDTQTSPVEMWQWVSYTDHYTGTGLPNQQVTLNQTPVIPSSVVMKVDGTSWNPVDNFVDSVASDLVYTWSMDLTGNYTIQFGDGVSGSMVPNGSDVQIQYNTGGGSAGAIGPDGLTTCLSNIVDTGTGTLVSLTAYNVVGAVPGGDAETTAQIKARAPVSVQAPRCLLTRSDIQNAVNALPGVFASVAATWQEIPTLPRYMIEVFVAPVGLGTPSTDLVGAINTLLTVTKPLVMGLTPVITGPTYVTHNYNLQVFAKTGYNQNSVQNSVAALLRALYSNTDPTLYAGFVVGFGVPVFMSAIISLIQQLPGVRNVIILSPGDSQLTIDQFPVLGTISFS